VRGSIVFPHTDARALQAKDSNATHEAFKPIPVRCGEEGISKLRLRLLTAGSWGKRILMVPVVAGFLGPLAGISVIAAHVSMLFNLGSKDDPLGYGCIAQKA